MEWIWIPFQTCPSLEYPHMNPPRLPLLHIAMASPIIISGGSAVGRLFMGGFMSFTSFFYSRPS